MIPLREHGKLTIKMLWLTQNNFFHFCHFGWWSCRNFNCLAYSHWECLPKSSSLL